MSADTIMANTLPIRISGSPCLRIEESHDDVSYYGPMTAIRIEGAGEHFEDPDGLVLMLVGKYPVSLLEHIALGLSRR